MHCYGEGFFNRWSRADFQNVLCLYEASSCKLKGRGDLHTLWLYQDASGFNQEGMPNPPCCCIRPSCKDLQTRGLSSLQSKQNSRTGAGNSSSGATEGNTGGLWNTCNNGAFLRGRRCDRLYGHTVVGLLQQRDLYGYSRQRLRAGSGTECFSVQTCQRESGDGDSWSRCNLRSVRHLIARAGEGDTYPVGRLFGQCTGRQGSRRGERQKACGQIWHNREYLQPSGRAHTKAARLP